MKLMKPGRELDILIHNNVMKKKIDYGKTYTISREEIENTPLNTNGPGCLCGSREREWCDACRPETHSSIPAYSTTWEGMGMVVEKMMPLRMDIENRVDVVFYDHCAYGSYRELAGNEVWPIKGETIQHATCLAALKAKGIEVE